MATARTASPKLTSLGAAELGRQIASGAVSSREAVEAHIARIEEVNPQLNAVVWRLYDEARVAADRADAMRARSESLGPLHGVPLTVKECFDVATTPTTAGLLHRKDHRAAADGFPVARLRAAGAILLGKTNVPQLLMMNESDNPLYGRANNPWDLERTPGGSSGGEAAIIAAGGSPLGLGSDVGGSVRLPATACGIASLKPTSNRLTNAGHMPILEGQEAIPVQPGVMARRVEDLELALRILAAPGQDAVEPQVADAHLGESHSVKLSGLRVAFYTDNGFFASSPAFRRAVCEAADALRAQGVYVAEWTPPDVAYAWRLYLRLILADGARSLRRLTQGSRRDWRVSRTLNLLAAPFSIRAALAWVLEAMGQKMSARGLTDVRPLSVAEYWKLTEERARYCAGFLTSLDAQRFDVILCPPDCVPAARHGDSFYLGPAIVATALYNLLGMPAGVVPATRVRAGEESDRPKTRDWVIRAAHKTEMGSVGLPIGVQVVARHWREDVALAVMGALESHFRAQPDYPAHPPI